MLCWLVCMQRYHCRSDPVQVQSTALWHLHEGSGLLMHTLHYLTIYRYTYTSLFPSQSVPVSLRKWHVWRDLQIAGLRTELIRTQTHCHTQPHNRNGQSGDWTQGLPHAKRVWYHYTNCPWIKGWKLKLIPSKPGWGLVSIRSFPFQRTPGGAPTSQVLTLRFSFPSLFLGVWCHLLLHFFLSWIKNRKSLWSTQLVLPKWEPLLPVTLLSDTTKKESKVTPRKKKESNVTPKNKEKWYKKKCKVTQERKQSDTKKKERKQRHTKKQRKMIQEKMQSDTRKKAKWHQEESKVTPRKKAIWHQERSQVAKKESKVTPVLLFLGAMLLSFLVSLCFLVADREPNAASWCPFAFFLGVPLLSTLGVTFLSFGVSRFYLGVAFASFLPPRCLLSWCHVGFFLGVTLLSFLGSHFFFLLPFFAFNY